MVKSEIGYPTPSNGLVETKWWCWSYLVLLCETSCLISSLPLVVS